MNRTLHTYHSVLRILCDAFQIDADGRAVRCEKRLIEEARRINHAGKMLAPIIDDAHLIDVNDLRRLRLLFEDFPKNHNLVLVAQPGLLTSLALSPNHDIQSRVTYSVLVPRLASDDMERFIHRELDAVALPHATFTPEAFGLVVRASEGYLRRARNLCVGSLLEAVRDRVRTVDLKQVNRVGAMKPRRRRSRHAQIHLPPLDAGYALTLAGIFERAIAALWRAHGDRMAELLSLRDAAMRAPKLKPADNSGEPDVDDDKLF